MATLTSIILMVERRVTRVALFLGSLALVLAFLAGAYQIIARFILFQSAAWSEPFIQLALIWMTYLTVASAMRTGSLISVDLMLRKTTGRLRAALRVFGTLAMLLLLGVLLWFGIEIVLRVKYQTIAGLNISASWAYLALPIGAAFSILALIAHVLDPPQAVDETSPDTTE
tara:strand:- start:2642 stop:3154 length:513 start_codon:yes stop_codon:yes gene_type:complete